MVVPGYLHVAHDHAPSEETVAEAISLAVTGFRRVFGDRLAQIWLYGSRARGDHHPDSDVDLLVVLHEPEPNHEVVALLSSVTVPILVSHQVLVEGCPTTLEKLETSDDDFHYFVRAESRPIDGL